MKFWYKVPFVYRNYPSQARVNSDKPRELYTRISLKTSVLVDIITTSEDCQVAVVFKLEGVKIDFPHAQAGFELTMVLSARPGQDFRLIYYIMNQFASNLVYQK